MGIVIVFFAGLILGVALRNRIGSTFIASVVSGLLVALCWIAVTLPIALQDGWLGWRVEWSYLVRAMLVVGLLAGCGGAAGYNWKEVLAFAGLYSPEKHQQPPRAGRS
jgi:hypothetical protein